MTKKKASSIEENIFLKNIPNRQNIYVNKIREYMDKIEKLQEELAKCKTENESLIFDLRECKTSLAFLEEKKAIFYDI